MSQQPTTLRKRLTLATYQARLNAETVSEQRREFQTTIDGLHRQLSAARKEQAELAALKRFFETISRAHAALLRGNRENAR